MTSLRYECMREIMELLPWTKASIAAHSRPVSVPGMICRRLAGNEMPSRPMGSRRSPLVLRRVTLDRNARARRPPLPGVDSGVLRALRRLFLKRRTGVESHLWGLVNASVEFGKEGTTLRCRKVTEDTLGHSNHYLFFLLSVCLDGAGLQPSCSRISRAVVPSVKDEIEPLEAHAGRARGMDPRCWPSLRPLPKYRGTPRRLSTRRRRLRRRASEEGAP